MKIYTTKPTDLSTADDIERRYPIIAKHYGFDEGTSHNAFGKRWVHSADRDFKDRRPDEWQPLGDVATRVLHKTATRMALRSPRKNEAA